MLNPLDDPRWSGAVFFPRPDLPYGAPHPGAFDRLFDVPGARLRLRVVPGPVGAPAILFFHGNGETALDYDEGATDFLELPATFLAAEYRGYGPSTGTPGLRALLADAHATLDEALRHLDSVGPRPPVIVMGRSLGSAPALELAASRPGEVSGLILESGFARAIPLLRLVGVPVDAIRATEAHGPGNLDKMTRVALPTLILHAEQDEIIPFADAQLLLEACADPGKRLVAVPRAGHNDIRMRAGRAYVDALRGLLRRVVAA